MPKMLDRIVGKLVAARATSTRLKRRGDEARRR